MNNVKLFSLLAVATLLSAGLTSCKNDNVVTIWGPEEHQTVYEEAAKKYKEAHPEFTAEIKFANLGDAGANGNVKKDIETAAEIYTFPNDQLLDLKSMGALGKVPEAKVEKMEKEHNKAAVDSGKFKGVQYAYPVTADNGFVFIYNKDAFTGTSVWNNDKGGLKDGYTFRDLYKALDEKAAKDEKWGDAVCMWPAGTAWYQCGIYFGVGADYQVEFNDSGKQTSSVCNFGYDLKEDGTKDYERGLEAIRCMVNTYTNADGTLNKHFVYGDDSTYNNMANTLSLPEEFTKDNGTPLAGIISWNNGNLKTNWKENYACEILPTLVSDSKQYGTSGKTYTWRTFSGFKLMGVNPYSQYARKSEENLLALHDFAEYLTGYETSIERFKANNAGPSNLQASEEKEIKENPFLSKLSEQFNLKDKDGKIIGYRVQDNVPQNFWTPIATLGNGVFNYIKEPTSSSVYKSETLLKNQLFMLQKQIQETVA